MGKLAARELQEILNCITPDERVLVPPQVGFDAGVHRLGDKLVVVATDPCTGVPEEWFGWLLINYAASDIALFGAKPEFCTITLLGPPRSTSPRRFQKIMAQTCKAADELGIAIVRGHTAMYGSLKDVLGVCTVYGTVEPNRLITSGGAKPGDLILCTKPLGIETITNYVLTHRETAQQLFGIQKQAEYGRLVPMQSCVREALALSEVEGVHAMHDVTEGGFVAALNELAETSKTGFRVKCENIAIPNEALVLQRHLGLSDAQMLAFSSTGTILAAVSVSAKQKVTETLQKLKLTASFIGEFTDTKERIIVQNNIERPFPSQADDPYTAMMTRP
ncbi:AIR synthase-related protein [Candidatus Bathycorpusculum sp.]|uniref:AIR synthase-related protein n=1 Tax=Candidatus Bathycorpusculum sp. TaxID=2994959 RepID=UPI0028330733|nr:AIR synthase-related protein [Candidatus Termitimicrobium sp.]MCL2432832.1 AIR synthase-related protein [Candidatus Termitimicrobium sp.]